MRKACEGWPVKKCGGQSNPGAAHSVHVDLQGALPRTNVCCSGTISACLAKFTIPKGIIHVFSEN